MGKKQKKRMEGLYGGAHLYRKLSMASIEDVLILAEKMTSQNFITTVIQFPQAKTMA